MRIRSMVFLLLSLSLFACATASPPSAATTTMASPPSASTPREEVAAPAVPARGPIVGERIPVAFGNARELARTLQMIFDAGNPRSQVSAVLVDGATDELLVLGTEEGIRAVHRLIDPVNRHEPPKEPRVEVLYLEHADAREVAHTLGPMIKGHLRVSVDQPTNSLVLQGDAEERKQLKSLVSSLDVPRRSRAMNAPTRLVDR